MPSVKSQWSPPFIGGSTRGPLPAAAVHPLVAMEPAVYRREHQATTAGHKHLERVAMEPAVYRREHMILGDTTGPRGLVAMEPAVYRREHAIAAAVGASRSTVVAMEPAVYRREHPLP